MAPVTIAARADKLHKTYGTGSATVVALDRVDFEVQAGEFTAIMGPSGSGKSTLMHLLAGLDSPTSGIVQIGEVNIATLSDTDLTMLRRDRIGFIFQAFNLVPTLTARENIVLPLTIAGRKIDKRWFGQIVEILGLTQRLNHKPHQLSGGQQQRVACARALMNRPDIVFADEPTGNLDSTSAAEVLSFLRSSVEHFSQTIVMVTHDPVAASYADRLVFLSDGRIVEDQRGGTPEEVMHTMSRIYPRHETPKTTTDDDDPATSPQPRIDGEPLFRDGSMQPGPSGEIHPETEAEQSAPRRAITE
ncbi:MAG: ABC transporter ATP-binding protein [Propionibacteriaceae bacterium]|nr:ABC transporter ATP-binding protein [Propionibacteriaceae bacterium]